MLHEIQNLFSNNFNVAKWDKKKASNFLVLLHRQSHELHRCLDEKKIKPSNTSAAGKLKNYFKRLQVLLKMKNNERCKWEIVKDQIRRFLQSAERITFQ
ncbi:interferon omega-1-like [Protopterus annectens]|uniref:interferon omega-1-like n=1 Tax=Protopterus annectens TaxID=7888 RepID=UPI001CFB42DB|nr:interferon omega-1-like [Protopterus annectens]